ncbi:MAG: hypothetical protein CMK44_00205 [Porticoccus sp.]|nr:hypothetical protein [Porticoccus sp.]
MKKLHQLGQKSFFRILFSFVILFITYFYYTDWYISLGIFTDDHFYWGSGEVYSYLKKHFSETYYFHRWTANIPHYIFQSIFGGYWGLFVYKNILLFISIICIFKFLNSVYQNNLLNIFLIITLIFYYGFFVRTIGNSYVSSENLFLILVLLYFSSLKSNQICSNNIDFKNLFILGILLGLLIINYTVNLRLVGCLLFLIFLESLSKEKTILKSLMIKFSVIMVGIAIISIILDALIGVLSGHNLINWFKVYKQYFYFYDTILIDQYNLRNFDYFKNPQYWLALINIFFAFLFLKETSKEKKNTSRFIIKLNIIYFITVILEPLHNVGSTLKYNYAYVFLFFCFINSAVILLNIIKNFQIFKKFNVSFFFIFFLINFYIISSIENNDKLYPHYAKQTDKTSVKKKIKILSKEVRDTGFVAEKLDKKLVLVDFRKHPKKSPTINTFYGNYSSLAEPRTRKPKECSQLKWNINDKSNTIIVAYHYEGEKNIKEKVLSLLTHCPGYEIYEYKKLKITNASIFFLK